MFNCQNKSYVECFYAVLHWAVLVKLFCFVKNVCLCSVTLSHYHSVLLTHTPHEHNPYTFTLFTFIIIYKKYLELAYKLVLSVLVLGCHDPQFHCPNEFLIVPLSSRAGAACQKGSNVWTTCGCCLLLAQQSKGQS